LGATWCIAAAVSCEGPEAGEGSTAAIPGRETVAAKRKIALRWNKDMNTSNENTAMADDINLTKALPFERQVAKNFAFVEAR
jgi:hypothetical protein